LVYLGIFQTLAYSKRTAELIEARKAFTSDVLYKFFANGGNLLATRTSADGTLLESSSSFLGVAWADVEIIQYPTDKKYVVQVTRELSGEKWSVHQYHQPFDKGTATQEVADRYGIAHEGVDDALKLYPRIETQLRSADVSFPGAGISLDLTSFAFVVPVIVFATLTLFGHWLNRVIRDYRKGGELQWVLVDARGGIVGLVARLWLIAIVAGPWVLSVVFVEAVALTLRTKGTLNTLALETASSLYVVFVLITLAISTKAAAQALVELRSLVHTNS
jgi:hypothetical protein